MINQEEVCDEAKYSKDLSSRVAQGKDTKKDKNSYGIKFISITETENSYTPQIKTNKKSNNYIISLNYKDHDQKVAIDTEANNQVNSITSSPQKKRKLIQQNEPGTETKKRARKCYKTIIRKKENEKEQTMTYAITNQPLRANRLLNYFQIKASNSNNISPLFSFGLSTGCQDSPFSQKFKGIAVVFRVNNQGNLEILKNSIVVFEQPINFKNNDVIGCGVLLTQNQIFLTLNGKVMLRKIKIICSENLPIQGESKQKQQAADIIDRYNYKLYPFFSIQQKSVTLETVFQNSQADFLYKFKEQQKILQQKFVEQQMKKQMQITEEKTYNLVFNYLKFYGYDKTSQLFENQMVVRRMKYYSRNSPLVNKEEYDKKHQVSKMDKNMKAIKKKKWRSKRVHRSYHSTSNELNNLEITERQQSDHYSGEISQEEEEFCSIGNPLISRTKIIDQEIEIQNPVKSQPVYSVNHKKMQRKLEQCKKSEQQKFRMQRILIMRSISDGKIEQAFKLYSKSFRSPSYIEAFFKAHIFLKNYYEQGLQSSISYAKKQKVIFAQFENYLMPFFNKKSLECSSEPQSQFRPLRQILFLICPEKKQELDIKNQFNVFAQFISKLICEEVGYYGCSKLELALNHFKMVQQKINQFEIPIGGMDLFGMGLL